MCLYLGWSVPWSSKAQRGDWQSLVPRALLKNGCSVCLFTVPWDFTWLTTLFKYHGEWFGSCIIQFPQDSRMHLVVSHRFIHNQVLYIIMNLIFSYRGRDFPPPVPNLQSIHLRDVGGEIAIEDWGKRVEFLSLLHCYKFASDVHSGGVHFLCTSLSGCHNGYFFMSLPSSAPDVPWLSWLHFYTKRQHTHPLLRIPSLVPLPVHFLLGLKSDEQVLT